MIERRAQRTGLRLIRQSDGLQATGLRVPAIRVLRFLTSSLRRHTPQTRGPSGWDKWAERPQRGLEAPGPPRTGQHWWAGPLQADVCSSEPASSPQAGRRGGEGGGVRSVGAQQAPRMTSFTLPNSPVTKASLPPPYHGGSLGSEREAMCP